MAFSNDFSPLPNTMPANSFVLLPVNRRVEEEDFDLLFGQEWMAHGLQPSTYRAQPSHMLLQQQQQQPQQQQMAFEPIPTSEPQAQLQFGQDEPMLGQQFETVRLQPEVPVVGQFEAFTPQRPRPMMGHHFEAFPPQAEPQMWNYLPFAPGQPGNGAPMPPQVWNGQPLTPPDHRMGIGMGTCTYDMVGLAQMPPLPVSAPATAPTATTPPVTPTEQPPKRGPGRPRKHPVRDPNAPKRQPGRPRGQGDTYKRLAKGEKAKMTLEERKREVQARKTLSQFNAAQQSLA